jgi:shikimate dehydrogenase
MEEMKADIEGKPVLVLGAGGAARVIAFELLKMSCSVTIANRDIDKGRKLRDEILVNLPDGKVSIAAQSELAGDYFCIVNTTPVGMAHLEGESPIKDKEVLKSAALVYDLIYNPYSTKLLRDAEAQGCRVLNGLSMLFYQAARSQEIWLNAELDEITKNKAYNQLIQLTKKDIY